MRSIPHVNRSPMLLSGLLSLVIAWSAWHPAEWGVWWMEMSWVLGVFVLLALTYRRFRFSNLAYGIVFIWLARRCLGCAEGHALRYAGRDYGGDAVRLCKA